MRIRATGEPSTSAPAADLRGRETPLAQPAADESADQIVTTADGGIAIGGTRDLTPGVKRPDGPFVEGIEFPLIVFSRHGQRILDQDLRIRGLRAANSGYLGMAWTGSATVRIALLDPVPLKARKAGALTLPDLARHIRLREY